MTASIGNSNMKINGEKTVKVGHQTSPCIYAYCRRGCDGNCNSQSRSILHSDAGVRGVVIREDAGAHDGSFHLHTIEVEHRELAPWQISQALHLLSVEPLSMIHQSMPRLSQMPRPSQNADRTNAQQPKPWPRASYLRN